MDPTEDADSSAEISELDETQEEAQGPFLGDDEGDILGESPQEIRRVGWENYLKRMLGSCFPFASDTVTEVKGSPDRFGPFFIPLALICISSLAALLCFVMYPPLAQVTPFTKVYDFSLFSIFSAVLVLPSYIGILSLLMVIIPSLEANSPTLQQLIVHSFGPQHLDFSPLSFFEYVCIIGYSLSIYLPLPLVFLIPLSSVRMMCLITAALIGSFLLVRGFSNVAASFWTHKTRALMAVSICMSTLCLIFFFWFVLFHFFISSPGIPSVLALQQCNRDSDWTIHGLWPSGAGFCSGESFSLEQIEALIPSLTMFWPSCYNMPNEKFWEHEWDKHGTCSGYSIEEYFQTTLDLRSRFYESCPAGSATNKNCYFCLSPDLLRLPASDCPNPAD